jgi:FkbM family methyltransferase
MSWPKPEALTGMAVKISSHSRFLRLPTIRRLHNIVLLAVYVRNWTQVYRARSMLPGPPLQFRNGMKLRGGNGDDPLQCFLTVFGDQWYRRHITEHDSGVYVDIGANIGMVSLDWASRFANVSIEAYEPDPRTFAILHENICSNRLQPPIAIYNEAVGRAVGTITMVRGDRSLATSAVMEVAGAVNEKFMCRTIGLDQLVSRCSIGGHITLIKVNAEGAEADIVEGASNETLDKISQFAIQYHTPILLKQCSQRLEAAGFSCVAVPVDSATGLLYATRSV